MPDLLESLAAEGAQLRDKKRREKAQELLNGYYLGPEYDEDFTRVLKKVFRDPDKADRLPVKIALLRKFADTRAQAFKERPEIVVVDGSGNESEDETERLAEIMGDGRWFERLRQASVYEQLLGTIHLTPRMLEDRFDLTIVTPAASIVFQDKLDPTMAEAIAYRVSQAGDTPHIAWSGEERWVYWSDEEHFEFKMDDQGNIRSQDAVEGNDDMVNPFGMLPFVKVQRIEPEDDSYWSNGADDVLTVQNAANVQLMSMLEASINQGFGISYSVNFPEALFEGGRGPGTHYNATNVREGDRPPEFGAVELSADLPEMKEAVEYLIQQAVLLHDLPPGEFRVDQGPESGFSKMVSRMDLLANRDADVERWRHVLAELFSVSKAVWNAEAAGPEFGEDSTVKVDFPEPTMMETPLERIERWKAEMELGIKSLVDVFMEANPDFRGDREAAEKAVAQIQQDSRQSSGGVFSSLLEAEE